MDFTPDGFKAKLLEFKTALESKDPAVIEKVIVENNPGVKDGDSFVQKVNAVANAVSDEINKATTQVGNAVGGAVNTAVANSHLEPTADNKFLYFIQNMFKTIMTFFNNSYQTISSKLNKSVDGSYSTNAWGSQEMGATGITYGGAMAIGLASSFLIFIIYKILKRFRSKSVFETASSYNSNLNNIISESADMLFALKNVSLKEDFSVDDKKIEIITNARTKAAEMIGWMIPITLDERNKIFEFIYKYRYFFSFLLLAYVGIIIGMLSVGLERQAIRDAESAARRAEFERDMADSKAQGEKMHSGWMNKTLNFVFQQN